MTIIKLYDEITARELNWELFVEGEQVRHYCQDLMEHGPQFYIENIYVKLMLLQVDELLLPVTITNGEKKQSYVVSPFTHYVSYTKEELRELESPLLERMLAPLIAGIGGLLRLGRIDQVVTVNNWMVSTNLYYSLSHQQLKEVTLFLENLFPQSAIMFRSLNDELHSDMLHDLGKIGYLHVPSRSVYLFNPAKVASFSKQQRKSIRQDRKFLKDSGYEVVEHDQLKQTDFERIRSLYNQLYIDKYSKNNPQFNAAFLLNAWEHNLLHFQALKREGRIDGVVAFFIRNGIMTTPILGYDLSLSNAAGLYRLCSIMLTEHSLKENLLLHRSAGAGEFKRNRGAKQTWEYSAVYTKHLQFPQRLIWTGLSNLIWSVGKPLMERKNL